MENSERPAYPVESQSAVSSNYHGLTKREEFAKAALQGLCGNPNVPFKQIESDVAQFYAASALKLADELLKQLES